MAGQARTTFGVAHLPSHSSAVPGRYVFPSMAGHEPVLIAVAHGSRDPRHAQTVAELAAAVRSGRPDIKVTIAYLDLSEPRLPDVLRQLDTAGVRRATAVPLLLTPAYHAKTDLPRALRRAPRDHPGLEVTVARALGPDPTLVMALERRLREAGIWPGDPSVGIVLGAAGTSDPAARRQIERLAAEWASTGWAGVSCAYASTAGPDVAAAAAALRHQRAERVVLAPYVLAPGILPDRLFRGARAARLDALAPVLGAAPEVASLIIERYEEIMLLTASA
jgi:sirohydrochlorin ferrochelatase